jgi:membrane protease subunit (stomatin/prohibitin family)
MGIFDIFKNRSEGCICWNDASESDVLYKFSVSGDEIKKLSYLIVKEGQGCLFIYDGRVAENITNPGKYSVKSDNISLFTLLEKMFFRFDGDKTGIWFYRTTDFLKCEWKTVESVKYIDPVHKCPIKLDMSGYFSFRLSDPMLMISAAADNRHIIKDVDVEKMVVDKFVQPVGDYLSQADFSHKEIELHLTDIIGVFAKNTEVIFTDSGFRLIDFKIEFVSVDNTEEEQLSDKTDVLSENFSDETMSSEHEMSNDNSKSQNDDIVEKLQRLKSLLDAGLIDENDYNMKKDELLNGF